MFQNNIVFVFVVAYCLCSKGDYSVAATKERLRPHSLIQELNDISKLNCDQFNNDHDVLRQFPFSVKLNPTMYENYEESTAQMSEDGTFVEKINIKNQNVVPLILFCLSNLTSLEIDNTPFENGMFSLLNIINFILNINLDIVPDSLANLKTLKFLNIHSTSIRKMTKQLATLINLEMIMFLNCSLTQLPDINNLHKLKGLYLPSNNINQVDEFQDLHLQALDLANNNLTEIPILKNKEDILFLSFSNNYLKDAEAIILYPNLAYLYLDHTTLMSIPSTIDKLQELTYLFIFGNQLTALPSNIINLPKLQILVANDNLFSSNYIKSIKETFMEYHPSTMLTI